MEGLEGFGPNRNRGHDDRPLKTMKRTKLSRAGFTLLESTIAIAMLGSVLSSVMYVLDSSAKAFRTGSMVARMDADADRALREAAAALRSAEAGWLNPPAPTGSEDRIDFQRSEGVLDNGQAVPGPVERLAFEYDDQELDDGIDNDGDGLIDEGRLILTRDIGGAAQRIQLARDVSEAPPGEILGNGLDDDLNGVVDDHGFSITQIGNRLTIRITLQRFDRSSQRVLEQTSERTVTLRN